MFLHSGRVGEHGVFRFWVTTQKFMDQHEGVVADSPAAEPVAPVAPAPVKSLSAMSDAERLEWRKNGTSLADMQAASSPATAEKPAATAASSDPDSAPAADDPDYKPKTAKRIKELLDRAERAEKALLASTAPPKPAALPAPAPAAATLQKPDPETFTYGTADPGYLDALTDYKVAKAREEDRTASADATRKAHTDAEVARIRASWTTRVDAAKTKHADFEAVAFAPFKPGYEIPAGSAMDAWILESDHGAEVLYALQNNPAEIKRLLALPPIAQTRELVKLEDAALAASTVKTTTTAPEPGPTLGVRAGDPASPAQLALKRRDTRAYIDAKNREEIAARKGQ